MKKCFFLFFVLNTVLSFAQNGTVSGKIESNDAQSFSNVNVIVKEINKSAVADQDGNFLLENIPYGKYTLEFSSLETNKKAIAIEVNAPTNFIPVVLSRKTNFQIDEVVIKKESTKSQIEGKGFAVNVIETKQAGLRNLQTIELLNRTAGVRIRQNGGLGSDANFNINGMSGNAVKIFIDGIPASTYGSSFDLNSIPPAMIERIEVYKGVVPGHLSEDALGGAINVILKKGMRNNLNVAASYGSFNTAQTNFSGLYRFENSGFTIKSSGFLNYSDNDYEVWGNMVYNILPNGRREFVKAKRRNDAYRSMGGVIELGYTDVKWADNFLIGITASDAYKEDQHGVFMTIPYKGRFNESDAQLVNLNYSKKDFLTKGLEVNLQAIYGQRNRMINDTVRGVYDWDGNRAYDINGNPVFSNTGAQQGAATLATIKRDVFSVRSGVSYAFNDNHKILVNNLFNTVDRKDDDELKSVLERNFQGTRDLSKTITSLTYEFVGFNDKLKTSLFGKYYQQKIERMNPIVEQLNGVNTRVEQVVSSNKKAEGYGIAASYIITPTVTVLASAEKAVRMPNENEVFGDAGDNIVENPNIKNETSENVNLGFKLGTFEFKKHALSFAVNGFIRDIQDRIGRPVQTLINSNIQVLPYVNQGNAKSKGFDFELNYTFDNNLNFTFNTSKFELTTTDIYNRKRALPNEPFFTINAGLNYTFKDLLGKKSKLNLFYNYFFVDTFNYIMSPGSNNAGLDYFDIPQQNIQDLGLSYVFPNNKLIISFDAKNIFNKQAFDNMGVQKPGSAFYLKLNYVFNNF